MGLFSKDLLLEFPVSIYHPATFAPPPDLNLTHHFANNSTKKPKKRSLPFKFNRTPKTEHQPESWQKAGKGKPSTMTKKKGDRFVAYQKKHAVGMPVMNESRVLPWNEGDTEGMSYYARTDVIDCPPWGPAVVDGDVHSNNNHNGNVLDGMYSEEEIDMQEFGQVTSEDMIDIQASVGMCEYGQQYNNNAGFYDNIKDESGVLFYVPVSPIRYVKSNPKLISKKSKLLLQEHSRVFEYSIHDEKSEKKKGGLDELWDASIFLEYGGIQEAIEHHDSLYKVKDNEVNNVFAGLDIGIKNGTGGSIVRSPTITEQAAGTLSRSSRAGTFYVEKEEVFLETPMMSSTIVASCGVPGILKAQSSTATLSHENTAEITKAIEEATARLSVSDSNVSFRHSSIRSSIFTLLINLFFRRHATQATSCSTFC